MPIKHSPAPWTETENDDGDIIVRMDKSHSVVIANLEGSCATCHANSRLIAMAPELLEILESVMVIVESANFIDTGGIGTRARKAIAKARLE